MNIKKNLTLRKRIARVFIENNLEILSTREIRDKLIEQLTVTGKRYSLQPPITQLSNVLGCVCPWCLSPFAFLVAQLCVK